jgi:hypothetical protein
LIPGVVPTLTPEYLEIVPEGIVELYSKLDETIIRDIVRRLTKTGGVTMTAAWQAERLQDAGLLYEDVIRRVAELTNASDQQVQALFRNAGIEALKYDLAIYEAAGLTPLPLRQSPAAAQVLQAGIQKTVGHLKNLSLTTAVTTQSEYINAVTLAEMQVESGAFDYVTAIRKAVKSAAKAGTMVQYPTGWKDRLDVAVRRAVLTGVSQTAAQISIRYADDMDCDLVETTAHVGARPAHQAWQGKVFSRSGSGKYPDFVAETGFGTGAGLCGWNCRHSFFPFFEGLSASAYPREKINEYNNRRVTYRERPISYYDATQMQRGMERKIRATKRELAGYDAGMKSDDEKLRNAMRESFNNSSVKLKQQETQLRDFLHQTGLDRQREREQVLGFGRSPAQKAVWANKKAKSYVSVAGTVTSTGVMVSDSSVHFGARAISRGFSKNDTVEALTSPLKIGKIRADDSQQFIGEHATIVINTKTGTLVTGWRTNSKRATKLKGGKRP